MNMQEEYPDFFGDAPIYNAECFKKNIQIRDNSFMEVITLEITNTISNDAEIIIND